MPQPLITIYVEINGKRGILTRTNRLTSRVVFPDGSDQLVPNELLVIRTRRPVLKSQRFRHSARTASGAPRVDIDDAVARELRGLTLEQMYADYAAEIGEVESSLSHHTPGMQRMLLGRLIRKARKR